MIWKQRRFIALVLAVLSLSVIPVRAWPLAPSAGQVYYVSSSDGDDDNDGLSSDAPFATISKINNLDLLPGDQVLFKCGDVWRADPLIITRSGNVGGEITFGSYPPDCEDKPVLSGSQSISGWSHYHGDIYMADLSAGANAGKFPSGINQLFMDGARLPLGRWPNLDAGDGGYSIIDGYPASDQITDDALPPVDWTGAIAHIKGMRWYILNRLVTATSGDTLTLGSDADCWDGSCEGWGYFLNNHINTLDQEGEWFYQSEMPRVYVFSPGGPPADGQIEGSVILREDGRAWGGIVLGDDLGAAINHIVIENFDIRNWYLHGITTPTNLHSEENRHLNIHNNIIANVDGVGINLATWVYSASSGEDGWRGGNHIMVSGNVIEGPNHRGIDTYAKQSTITGNQIYDVGLIKNLGASGMGCGLDASGGLCTEDGDGIRIKVDEAEDSGNRNQISGNRLERIAYNGIDIFGHNNILAQNVIQDACIAKGDCGGIRTFGRDNLATSPVHDLEISENLILNTTGNTDGCHETYRALFGFGLYIDHYSALVTVADNTIISSTVAGILFQQSTGRMTGNTLYNNSNGSMYSSQVALTGYLTEISEHSDNVLYALNPIAATLAVESPADLVSSDRNALFHPYAARHISANGLKTLAEWQAASGKDAQSYAAWFSLSAGEAPRSRIFYNDTAQSLLVDLGTTRYQDLEQNDVTDSLPLAPYSSQVLVASNELPDLTLAMAFLGGSAIIPGGPLHYTLAVANAGTYTATSVVLTHTMPSIVDAATWDVSASLAGTSAQPDTHYVWALPDLAPGASGVLTVTGVYTDALQTGLALLLNAELGTPDLEVSTANNTAFLRLGTWNDVYLPLIMRNGD